MTAQKQPKPKKPNVYRYEDFRLFLNDMYHYKKAVDKAFSFREFSKRAGFKSSNFLNLIMKGQRNLTDKSAPMVAQGFSLSGKESDYFCILVLFNQNEDLNDKSRLLNQLLRMRHQSGFRFLEDEVYQFYATWFYVVIREMVECDAFQEDPEWIAKQLKPNITAKQASDALIALEKIGLLERDAYDKLFQSDRDLSTSTEVRSVAVSQFHKTMLQFASQAIEDVPSNERDVTASTLTVDVDELPKIKKRIAEFHYELIKTYGEATDGRKRIYQLNLQLFPVSEELRYEDK